MVSEFWPMMEVNGWGGGASSLVHAWSYTPVGTLTTAERDLWTPISINLPTDGDSFHVIAWGTFAANANTKSAKMYADLVNIADTSGSAPAPNNRTWKLEALVIRSGSTSQVYLSEQQPSGSTPILNRNVTTVVLNGMSTALSIRITGVTAVAAPSDVVFQAGIIKVFTV
jgi:hypothetical protein